MLHCTMRLWVVVAVFLAIAIFMGCSSGGGGGGLQNGVGGEVNGAVLSGKAFFADRQFYGSIPIQAIDPSGRIVATTKTDNNGSFAFSTLPPGIYDIVANTGDSQVVFASSVQVTGVGKQLAEASLLCIRDSIVDQIKANSARITFRSNKPALSSVEYGAAGGSPVTQAVSQTYSTDHKITLSGLDSSVRFSFTVILVGEDGQKFKYQGLSARTTAGVGPTNLSIAINNGDYETRNAAVKVALNADLATKMRVGESEDLSAIAFETFAPEKDFTLGSTPGTKRVYCQFQDAVGIVSPVIDDSILFSVGVEGYVGVWINDGRPYATSTSSILTLLFPGASQMMVSASSNFLNSFWEYYGESKSWTLTTGDGQKDVFVRFKGGTADPLRAYSASIILDTSVPTGTMRINAGAATTATTTVSLDFTFKENPFSMQLANDAVPASNTTWETFVNPKPWVLSSTGSGTKTVYANFRTKSLSVFGPLSASIELDNVAPTGNTAALRVLDDPNSASASSAIVASLPVYLHFDVVDSTTDSMQYAITPGASSAPANAAYIVVPKPFRPVSLNSGAFPAIDNIVWYRSLDELGNVSAVSNVFFTIAGPKLVVAPADIVVRSNDQVQFTAVGEQTSGDIGPINWFLNGPGTLNGAQYTAPALIDSESTAAITARSSFQPEVSGNATIRLRKRVELSYLDPSTGTEKNLTQVTQTIGYSATTSFVITVLNSSAPFDIFESPDPGAGMGSVSIAEEQILTGKYKARLIYSSPTSGTGQKSVTIRVRPRENPSASGTFIFSVDDLPIMNLTPLQVANATPGAPIHLKATVQSTIAETVQWTISGAGSFNAGTSSTFITTQSVHEVDVFGSDTRRVETLKVTAQLESNPAKAATCTITVTPPVKVELFKNVLMTEKFDNDTAETVAEVGKLQFFVKVTPAEILDTSVAWTVNGGAGDTTMGTIDANGLYQAPDTVSLTSVKIKATSKFDTLASKEITVKLSDFWVMVRGNMTDSVTGSPMPIYSVLVNPYTASGSDFQIFAGTSGYGLWNSSLPDTTPPSWDQKPWKGVQNLSTPGGDPDGKYVINASAMLQDGTGLYAATMNGLYYVSIPAQISSGVVPDLVGEPVDLVSTASIPAINFIYLTMGRTSKELFVSTSDAVYKIVMAVSSPLSVVSANTVIDLVHPTRTWETRSQTDTGSPPVTIYQEAYSDGFNSNPYQGSRIKALAYDEQNDRLFAGGENQLFLNISNTSTGNLAKLDNRPIFTGPAPSISTYMGSVYVYTLNQPLQTRIPEGNPPGVCLAIALDVNTRSTLWATAVDGVKRSIDAANSFSSLSFTGDTVNTKCILVDPTNVINVMSGSEDGLFRSTNAGVTWKRIKSGLGNNKTVNSLTQAGGPAGARRRVWVGLTGGVFLGRQSLDLE